MLRLNLRTFLFLSLPLGAVALPLGYKYFKAQKEAEIEKLNAELVELWRNEPTAHATVVVSSQVVATLSADPKSTAHKNWQKRVSSIEARLQKLTGKKPQRPEIQPHSHDDHEH